ncbi:MAG: imidazole glycerol phosphate synthase subunit HisH [Anaerolineales bacterium]|jgi:glutamine amidotransferase|nr:imidazole glycerol phosphate synthase subunit HisH [Anaerolineales bacterium]
MITLVDYKAGNLTSVRRALTRLGLDCQVSGDPETVRRAEKVIFPGVGAAGAAMGVLRERGLDAALKEAFAAGTPILGICIGCQIILEHSEEDDAECLGLLAGKTVRFGQNVEWNSALLKIPHMGWNAVSVLKPHPLLAHLRPGDEFYFVHSFYPQPADASQIYAVSDYGGDFPAAIGKDNLFAVQFHTEKSGGVGLKVLENFANW